MKNLIIILLISIYTVNCQFGNNLANNINYLKQNNLLKNQLKETSNNLVSMSIANGQLIENNKNLFHENKKLLDANNNLNKLLKQLENMKNKGGNFYEDFYNSDLKKIGSVQHKGGNFYEDFYNSDFKNIQNQKSILTSKQNIRFTKEKNLE